MTDPRASEDMDRDALQLREAFEDATYIFNHAKIDTDIERRASRLRAYLRAMLKRTAPAAQPVTPASEGKEIRLFDGQWLNIVNSGMTIEEAVKATEEGMRRNLADGKWPNKRERAPT